jgi:hypothetical protein
MNYKKLEPPPGFVPKTPRVLNSVESSEVKVRGLGDVIARATSAIGIKPCGGCKQRQETLNKLIPFNTNEPESTSDGTK